MRKETQYSDFFRSPNRLPNPRFLFGRIVFFVLSLWSVRHDSQSNNGIIFRAPVSFVPTMYKHAQTRAHWPGQGEEFF